MGLKTYLNKRKAYKEATLKSKLSGADMELMRLEELSKKRQKTNKEYAELKAKKARIREMKLENMGLGKQQRKSFSNKANNFADMLNAGILGESQPNKGKKRNKKQPPFNPFY
jgi:cell shape-determining protein MreC